MQSQDIKLIPLIAIFIASTAIFFSISSPHSAKTLGKEDAFATAVRVIPEPEINAHAYIVKIAGKNRPLLKRREWKRVAPASLTKLLTAVIATEMLPKNRTISFSKDAKNIEEKKTKADSGEAFLSDDMIRFALIMSANDAVMALTEEIGAGLGGAVFSDRAKLFMELMNQKARIIGMKNSHFENSTGLDEDGHSATAEDLAILGEYVLRQHPELTEIMRTSETSVISASGKEYLLESTNELLKEFPALIGGKTGFTDKAKGALMLLYPVKTGQNAVIVILGSDNRFEDGRAIIHWLEENF